MTRQEFNETITNFYELIRFCIDYGYERYTDDIYSEEDRNDCINERLVEMAEDATSWVDLLDTLDGIPTGCDYYRYEYSDWIPLDDNDFDERLEEVRDQLAEDGFFDDGDEDANEEEAPVADDDEEEEAQAVDDDNDADSSQCDNGVDELCAVCHSNLMSMEAAAAEACKDGDDVFEAIDILYFSA